MELEIKDLSKNYGDTMALAKLSLKLHEGIYGILGPNGAGKSTLMNLLTDNLQRTTGQILLDGKEILSMGREYRLKLGYMPQQQGFYEMFSASEFLRYIGSLKGIAKKRLNDQIENILQKVNLYEHRDEEIGSFSGGMRQRVLLAQALLGEPRILILDEPTAGLDPRERINIRNMIAEISGDKIILVATHVVSDIECIANEILLMKSGKLVRIGSPSELIMSVHGKVGEISCSKSELLALQEHYQTGNTFQRKDGIFFRIVGDELPEEALPVNENLTLEEVYLYYLGV